MSNKIPSINSLHKEKDSKEKSKLEIFEIVLNKAIEKVVYANRHTDQTFVIFEVPKVLIGYPMYDMKSCILFLIQQFSARGYLVEYIDPLYLYIDWGSNKDTKNATKSEKLKEQTRNLLKKFPNASKIEYVYQDTFKKKKK